MQELFEALEPGDYYKTEELNILPGMWADVYRPIPFIDVEAGESNDWYLKFYVEGECACRGRTSHGRGRTS